MTPKQPLSIVHEPPGYKMDIRIAAFADRHVVFRTGELQAISLDENEVKQVIAWLQEWLSEGEVAQTAKHHPEACTCDQCAADRLAFCGYED